MSAVKHKYRKIDKSNLERRFVSFIRTYHIIGDFNGDFNEMPHSDVSFSLKKQ